ncbi:MAG: vanadium-dependent haloperoxidase, partial [Steroidobacteraceae bacterium]
GLSAATLQAQAHGDTSAQIAVEWNERAYESALAADQFLTFKGHRALAMMHLAQHDALNHVEHRFDSYLKMKQATRRRVRADARAAAAQAAHDVLLSQYPGDQSDIDALLVTHLGDIRDGSGKEAGRDIGRQVAAAILARRTGDGIDKEGTYTFSSEVGSYQTTPDWNGFVAWPALGAAKPFFLCSGDQVRPSPPPALASAHYAAAFNEVKQFGAADSTKRSADQTAYALWWMEFAEGSVNRLARTLATDQRMDLWDAARMFALLNAALIDTYIAVWDSKFHFNHWRPYTAIRDAERDGNPQTTIDPQWNSLRPAPPFPDYVSAHAAGCATTFGVLQEVFPRVGRFTMDSKTAPSGMPTRSFETFRAAARECADSRVQIGFHFRYATDAGAQLGREIAEIAIDERLRAAGHKGPNGRRTRAQEGASGGPASD